MKKKLANPLSIRCIVLALVIVIALLAANTEIFPLFLQEAARDAFGQISASGDFAAITLPRLLGTLIALAVCILGATLVKLVLSRLEQRNRRMLTISSLVKSLSTWIFAIIAVIWVLSILGVDVTAALAGVGIVALVLSFGAQSLVEDVVTGIFIMFEGAFNVGDIVVLDDFRGFVRSIGVRTTIIEDTGGNLKIVNNSDIRNIQNRSSNVSVAICEVGISYGADLAQAETVVRECLQNLWETRQDVLAAPPVYAGVQALADSAVVLRINATVQEENIFIVQRLLNREIKLALDQGGIEIPFPQVVVHQA